MTLDAIREAAGRASRATSGMLLTTNPFGKALRFFEAGELGAGMAVLALGLDSMADRQLTTDVQDQLHACAVAAWVFAHEWSALSPPAAAKCAEVLVTRAAWVPCPDCEGWLCLVHLQHVVDCPCPRLAAWPVDPYVEGRPERARPDRTSDLGGRR